MSSDSIEPQLGAESFSCPHCHALAHQDWYSLFLKQENATDVVVLTLEALMLAKGNESDQFLQHLKDNVLAYEYQEHPQNLKVKLLNLHVSRCYNCKGFTVWVRDRLVFPVRETNRQTLLKLTLKKLPRTFRKLPRTRKSPRTSRRLPPY